MLHSKVNQIDVNDLAEKVVEFYCTYLRKIKDQVLLDFKNDSESVIEFSCQFESPVHMSRREVQTLKSLIHTKLPMCGNIWTIQSKKYGKRYVEVATEFSPGIVHMV